MVSVYAEFIYYLVLAAIAWLALDLLMRRRINFGKTVFVSVVYSLCFVGLRRFDTPFVFLILICFLITFMGSVVYSLVLSPFCRGKTGTKSEQEEENP